MEEAPDIINGETCPICHQNTLILTESERDIPFFGVVYLFSMNCTNDECKYSMSDVETVESHEPTKYSLEVKTIEDLNARVVKSSEATVKIGSIASIEPGSASQGFISNVEGVLKRMLRQMESFYESEDDTAIKNKLKNKIKKLKRVMTGFDPITITVSDPSGNSAIIHDNAVITPLKKGKK
ncbi:MAG: ZPR1 zinc finger domain-containing protein [Candidatus Woesearchaeota archaeon]